MVFPTDAAVVYRDFETDGVPSSGNHAPKKSEIRRMHAERDAALVAGLSNGGLIYDAKASMDADKAHAANASAWVIGDSTVANNGIYRKTGASGAGSWVRIADLPYSIIHAQNNNSGTPNAVKVTASVPVATTPYAQLISVPFTAANSGAMTLEINGDIRPLVTNTGQAILPGYVKAGMAALVQIDNAGNYRLFTYGDASASQAAAEAAAAAAIGSANSKFEFDDASQAKVATIPPTVKAIRLNGYDALGDGRAGLYVDTANGSADTFTTNGGARAWYRAADVGRTRFSEDALSMWRYTLAKYRKRIVHDLPIRGPGYSNIIATGLSFLIPQAFTVDWSDGLLYILCSGDATSGHQWVRVHNFWTGAHVATFGTQMTQSFSEGIVVRREGSTRKLYVQTDLDTIGRFDITALPAHLSTKAPEATFPVGLHSQFDYRNGVWLVQQRGPALGADPRRNVYAVYSEDLATRKGTLLLSNSDAGPWTSSAYADFVPKIQTTQIGDGFYFASCGGFHGADVPAIPYSFAGVKLFNSDGSLLDENLIDPEAMSKVLVANGVLCRKIEYEGAIQAPDGKIYSLCMTLSPESANGATNGILIFEEFALGGGCIDFASCARTYPKVDIDRFSSGIWPRSPSGKIHNPWTGAELTSWEQICDMMRAMDVPRLAYYSSATTGIIGIGGDVIPAACLVEFLNHDNQSWTVNIFGSGFQRLYRVFGTAGARSVVKRAVPINGQRGVTAAEVQAGGGLTVSIAEGNYFDVATQAAAGTLRIDPAGSLLGNTIKIKRRGGAFNLIIQDGTGATITTLTANQNAELMMGSTQYYLWQ